MKEIFLADIKSGDFEIKVPQQIQGLIDPNNYGGFGGWFIGKIIFILFILAIVLALFYIVYGGFKWIMSQGDPKQITTARETIIYAAVGLGLVLGSFFIVNIFARFLGAPLF